MKNNGYIYKHVVVLGVDGAGTFFSRTDTPNMDRILQTARPTTMF